MALCADDPAVVAALDALGLKNTRVAVDDLESALRDAPSVLVLDADAPGMLSAIQRLRRIHPAGQRPAVVVIASAGDRPELHAVRPDVILPRSLSAHDVALRVQSASEATPQATTGRNERQTTPRPRVTGGASGSMSVFTDGLSGPLLSTLRAAVADMGGDASVLELPSFGDSSLDDLVPPELLEPLDAPLEVFPEEAPMYEHIAPNHRGPTRPNPTRTASQNGLPTPLMVDGDLRLSGLLGRHALGQLLPAAARARASGDLVLRQPDSTEEWHLSLSQGHLMALHSTQPEDQIGPLLARLGYLPAEAARYAMVPLSAGPRGAGSLAARGYIAPDSLAPTLASAAQEMLADLLCLPTVKWDLRASEAPIGIPLPTRSLEALLVLIARARIEPADAYNILGGDGTTVTFRGDPQSLSALPLSPPERDAASAARGTVLAAIVRQRGDMVLPSLVALYWLGHLRAEGPSHESDDPLREVRGAERSRLRVLSDAAERGDHLAVLGISQWATRISAQTALHQRRRELETMRARHAQSETIRTLFAALDAIDGLLKDPAGWERYVKALR